MDATDKRWRDSLITLEEVARRELVEGAETVCAETLRWIQPWRMAADKDKVLPIRRATTMC